MNSKIHYPPPTDLASSDLKIDGIDFSGKLTGEIKYYNVGNINNHNAKDTGLSITSSQVGNISDVNKLTISSSSSGDISNNDTTAALTLTSMSNQSVGNIRFGGTLNATFDNTSAKDITIFGGNATFNLSNSSEIGSLDSQGGTTNITLANSTINGKLSNAMNLNAAFGNNSSLKGDFENTDGNAIVSFADGSSMGGSVINVSGNSSSSFSSDVSKISFASLGDIDQATLTQEALSSYLRASKISNFSKDIITHGGVNKVDFQDSLHLGGAIDTDGGVSNVTLSFSDAFISKLKSNDMIKGFLYDGSGPEFFINTSNGTSNIALSGDIKGIAHLNYTGGNTNIVFSDTIKKATPAAGAAIGDTSDFNNPDSFDISSSDVSKKQVMVNGHTFEDGLLIRLDAKKANDILSSYRDIFGSNEATFYIDKITDSNTYSARISGVLVGEVDSLASSSALPKNYEAVLEQNAAFIGSLNITDRNISIELSKGSKLVLSSDSKITKLSSNEDNAPDSIDFSNIIGDTLNQKNAMIDLATQGIPSSASNIRTSFSTLKIGEINDLNHAVFRLAYNPNADAKDSGDKKADHIIIGKVSNSGADALSDYLQVFQASQDFVIGDLRDKNIIVLSVANDTATGMPNIKFNDKSSVQQGYDVISTTFYTKEENSSDGDPAMLPSKEVPSTETPSEAPTGSTGTTGTSTDPKDVASSAVLKAADTTSSTAAESSSSSDESKPTNAAWTNYYVKSADVRIKQNNQDMTQAAISTNYSIFLANINDLNKRLGELRGNSNAQGVWGRIFNGMSKTNRGEEVSIYNTNIQAGYDFSIPHDGARSYFGGALSYGYNALSGTDFTGKAQSIEVGAYYSFVSEEGFYTDTILKYAFITNKLSLPKNQSSDDSLNSSTISLGEEFGYRWNFLLKDAKTSRHSVYLEPQAELILGYVGDGSLDQVNGNSYLKSSIDSILAFRTRIGGVVGYSLKTTSNQSDFRLGLSYVGDFVGGGNISMQTNFSKAQQSIDSNHMAMLSLGVNSILSDKWRVYADVDTSFLGKYYNQTYLISVGGRYSFGKKSTYAPKAPFKQPDNKQEPSKQAPNAKLPNGYYWVVYALEAQSKLAPKEEELLKKYPIKVSYESQDIKDKNGKTKKVLFRYYLLGGFDTKEGAIKNQNIANQLSEILNKKKGIKALLKQIK